MHDFPLIFPQFKVLQNHRGDVILARAKHGYATSGFIVEEARSSLHAIKSVFEFGVRDVIIDVCCLPLISSRLAKFMILSLVSWLEIYILSFIKNFVFFVGLF